MPDEGEKSQEYFVYFKISRQNMAKKNPLRRALRFIQRLLNERRWLPCCEEARAEFPISQSNTAEATANALIKILIEANQKKVEQAIRLAAEELPQEMDDSSMQEPT